MRGSMSGSVSRSRASGVPSLTPSGQTEEEIDRRRSGAIDSLLAPESPDCPCDLSQAASSIGRSFINSNVDGNQKEDRKKEENGGERVTPKDGQSSVMCTPAGHNRRGIINFVPHNRIISSVDGIDCGWAADFLTFEQKDEPL